MAKKSKSKKRRQANKKASQESMVTNTPIPAPLGKKPPKTSANTSEQANIDNTTNSRTNELETEQVDTLLSENPPREPITQNKLIMALAITVIILIGILIFFYSKTQQATTELQKQSQEQLNNVNETQGDSLGSSPAGNMPNPQ